MQEAYQSQLQQRGYQSDPAQAAAVAALDACAKAWANYKKKRGTTLKKLIHHPQIPQGVYMHGGVGRGKSFLMDCFYQAVPLKRKTRLHFHEFMREVHKELRQLQGIQNPLDVLGKKISQRFKLICFDEFHVANITDAMILHRLLAALAANGVGLVMTSNFAPDGLYPNGLHRERILPAIELLKQTMQICNVDHGVDYRLKSLRQMPLYYQPINEASQAAMLSAWQQLKAPHEDAPILEIEGRSLQALGRSGDVVWFDFSQLCDSPRSQNDYLELATRYHTVLLSGVPEMGPERASAARRFTWLVDVLYDRRIKLIIEAEVAAENLYTKGSLAHEFARTVSRLAEMRSEEYLGEQRRTVDTHLT